MNAYPKSSAALRQARPHVIGRALELQGLRWPGIFQTYSVSQMANTVKDTGFHVDFLASAVWAGEQVLFDDYVAWAKVLFENYGIPLEWLTGSLADVRAAVADTLEEADARPAIEVIDAALAAFGSLCTTSPSFIEAGQPLEELAARYLVAIVAGDREKASGLVLDSVEAGTPVPEIYTYVFQRAQLELGRLWQSRAINVAQEHLATAITQVVMSQLYPRIFSSEKNGRTLVATCVGDELHEIGIRMVADVFEMDGWDTYYLGANTPAKSIVETIADTNADVLALSATMGFHVETIADVIRETRADPRSADVRILVGGYPFNLSHDLWRRVGADAYAPDAQSAIAAAGGGASR